MTTLSDGLTTITFSDDLQWSDEFAWATVEQTTQRTITGALIVQSSVRSAGRPITLAADADSAGWLQRSTVDQLSAWAAVAGKTMTLTYRGVAHQVAYRHQDVAITATPVVPFADVLAGDYYHVTLRFLEL